MNADELLRHYERIADAPEAVARLRRFVLDLAVRGKLVPQDPREEPASELLKRIAAEKARLIEAGVVRSPRTAAPAIEAPFPIASGWQWTQLSEVGLVSPRNDAADSEPASFVPMTQIPAEYGAKHGHEVRPWGEIKKGYTHFADGDVGLAKITPCFENGKSTVFRQLTGGIGSGTTELHVVRPLLVVPDYVVLFLKCPFYIESGIPRMTGTAGQKRVPYEYFANSPFPLPPLAEQHRIVAKVDELMALCDRLEAARAQREAARDRLARSCLARLDTPDPETFREDACFALDALPALTARPDQIKPLRQTILNLAVRGKLVPQDPAGSLPAQIEDRSAVHDAGAPAIPATWRWMPIEAVCEVIVDCPHSTPKFVSAGVVCLDTNAFKNGAIVNTKIRYVSEETYQERVRRLVPQAGDIVFAREGSVGESVIVPDGLRCCLGQRVMLFRPAQHSTSRYFQLALSAPSFLSGLMELHKGIGAKHVNVSDMRVASIPLPPLAEQHRIVAKVDELMALCDQLEASLARADEHRRRLLEALLHDALEPARLQQQAA